MKTSVSTPADVLVETGPGLWVAPSNHHILGVHAQRQLIVAKLPAGGLWIHSPSRMTAALRVQLEALGRPAHVVGPNRWHDELMPEFQAVYPEAEFHGAPGLAGDRPDIRFALTLSDTPHADWAGVMEQHLVRGMPRFNEVVFFHRPSRSLILADLAMNVRTDGTLWDRIAFTLVGAWGRFTPTRLCKRMMFDRAAVRASIEQIHAWDFDRIVMGHGQNIETGGRKAWRAAFAFL